MNLVNIWLAKMTIYIFLLNYVCTEKYRYKDKSYYRNEGRSMYNYFYNIYSTNGTINHELPECLGALISYWHLISGDHCVFDANPNDVNMWAHSLGYEHNHIRIKYAYRITSQIDKHGYRFKIGMFKLDDYWNKFKAPNFRAASFLATGMNPRVFQEATSKCNVYWLGWIDMKRFVYRFPNPKFNTSKPDCDGISGFCLERINLFCDMQGPAILICSDVIFGTLIQEPTVSCHEEEKFDLDIYTNVAFVKLRILAVINEIDTDEQSSAMIIASHLTLYSSIFSILSYLHVL